MSMTSQRTSLASCSNVPVPASVTTNLRTHRTVEELPSSVRSVHSWEQFRVTADCGSCSRHRKVKQLTSNRKPHCDRENMPRWSPDGSRLVYSRQADDSGQSTTTAVFVIDANGRTERASPSRRWSPETRLVR